MSQRGAALLVSPVRRRIVETLEGEPDGLTAAEVGHRLGLHPTSARFHLEQLAGADLVEASFHRHGTGRPHKRYAALPDRTATSAPEEAYRMLAQLLTEALDPSEGGALSPEEAGARWAREHVRNLSGDGETPLPPARTAGQWLAKVGHVLDVLESWGYEPSLRTSDHGRTAEVALARCPFRDLAEAHTEVVCAAHRGLLLGALDALGEPGAEVRLQPFALPGVCIAHLRTRPVLDRRRSHESPHHQHRHTLEQEDDA
jgi:predicted ArsR family transcriptional regulator